MKRREFLRSGSSALFGVGLPVTVESDPSVKKRINASQPSDRQSTDSFRKPRDFRKEPFRRLVILGESHVAGGAGSWLRNDEERYADVVASHQRLPGQAH